MTGGEALKDSEIDKAKERRKFQLKIKKEKKLKQQFLLQKREEEERALLAEEKYKDANEEIDVL